MEYVENIPSLSPSALPAPSSSLSTLRPAPLSTLTLPKKEWGRKGGIDGGKAGGEQNEQMQ